MTGIFGLFFNQILFILIIASTVRDTKNKDRPETTKIDGNNNIESRLSQEPIEDKTRHSSPTKPMDKSKSTGQLAKTSAVRSNIWPKSQSDSGLSSRAKSTSKGQTTGVSLSQQSIESQATKVTETVGIVVEGQE